MGLVPSISHSPAEGRQVLPAQKETRTRGWGGRKRGLGKKHETTGQSHPPHRQCLPRRSSLLSLWHSPAPSQSSAVATSYWPERPHRWPQDCSSCRLLSHGKQMPCSYRCVLALWWGLVFLPAFHSPYSTGLWTLDLPPSKPRACVGTPWMVGTTQQVPGHPHIKLQEEKHSVTSNWGHAWSSTCM